VLVIGNHPLSCLGPAALLRGELLSQLRVKRKRVAEGDFAPEDADRAVRERDSIEVWSSSSEGEPLQLRGHGPGHQVLSLSADGKWLISGGNDGQIRIWRVRTWELVSRLSGYDGKVSALDLAAAGSWLYAGVIKDGTGLLTVRKVGGPDLDSIVVPGRPSCIVANKSEVWVGCADGTVCRFAHEVK